MVSTEPARATSTGPPNPAGIRTAPGSVRRRAGLILASASTRGGGSLLTSGLPAEGIHVELEVDASDRIIAETLAAPKHLTRRTFTYPR
jgi:hypothetical protein